MSIQSSQVRMAVPPWRAVPQIPKIVFYIVGFFPAVWWFWLGVTDRLGADPMRVLEHALGLWTLRFLIASLVITPLRQLTDVNLLRYRRALGLLAFYYALLHLTTYLVLDQGLDFDAIWADILKRLYITIGMACFVVLLPLAVTSNNLAIRRLSGKVWQGVHRLVYLAAILAVLHFLMSVKSWSIEPVNYAIIVAILLGHRLARSLLRGRDKGNLKGCRRPVPKEPCRTLFLLPPTRRSNNDVLYCSAECPLLAHKADILVVLSNVAFGGKVSGLEIESASTGRAHPPMMHRTKKRG